MKFEGQKGVYEVKEDKCSCGHENCYHLRTEVLLRSFKGGFLTRSALHKEIRRGCLPRALKWAALVGKDRAKQYIRGIVHEEFRHLDFSIRVRELDKYDADTLVEMACRAVKKWECKCRLDVIDHFLDGFAYSQKNGESVDVPKEFFECDSPRDFYRLYWRCQQQNKQLAKFTQLCWNECLKKPDFRPLARHYNWTDLIDRNSTEFLIDCMTGKICTSCGLEYRKHKAEEDKPPMDVDVPVVRGYVHDVHTGLGKSRVKDGFAQLAKDLLAVGGRLDLRWSGQFTGIVYRYKAYEKYGAEYVLADGRDVKLPKEAFEVDYWYYDL